MSDNNYTIRRTLSMHILPPFIMPNFGGFNQEDTFIFTSATIQQGNYNTSSQVAGNYNTSSHVTGQKHIRENDGDTLNESKRQKK